MISGTNVVMIPQILLKHLHLLLMRYALILAILALFLSLGFWQLHRATEKENWLANPIQVNVFQGHFIEHKTLLWENQFFERQWGYQVMVPFETQEGLMFLVDRGWIKAPVASRNELPIIPSLPQDQVEIKGYWRAPSYNRWLQSGIESQSSDFPLRVQQLNLSLFETRLGLHLEPNIFHLMPAGPFTLSKTLPTVAVSPQKHRAYAAQWFGLAVALIAFIIYYQRKQRGSSC